MVLRVLPLSGYCYLFFATSSRTLVYYFFGDQFSLERFQGRFGMNAGWGLIRELSDHRVHTESSVVMTSPNIFVSSDVFRPFQYLGRSVLQARLCTGPESFMTRIFSLHKSVIIDHIRKRIINQDMHCTKKRFLFYSMQVEQCFILKLLLFAAFVFFV